MRSVSSILLPVDFSERSAPAARYARSLASQFESQLILLHVLPPLHLEFGAADVSGYMVTELCENRVQQANQELSSFLAAEFADDASVERLVLEGDPSRCIVETAHERAGVILMPTHGYGPFRRFILGSVTAKVLHDADCPVWTGVHIEEVRPAEEPFRKILCAVDLGPQSARVLAWAAWLQREFQGELTLFHAVAAHAELGDEPDLSWREGISDIAEEELLRLQREVGAKAEILLEAGDPVRVICSAAARVGAGTLVIGRGSAAGTFGRLRTNSYALVRQSPCPVVSV